MRFSIDEVAMKDAYIDALMELAEENPQIVVLDADLMNSNSTIKFLKRFQNGHQRVKRQYAGMAAGRQLWGKSLYPYLACFKRGP